MIFADVTHISACVYTMPVRTAKGNAGVTHNITCIKAEPIPIYRSVAKRSWEVARKKYRSVQNS